VKRQLPEGAKVKFQHERLFTQDRPLSAQPRGGKTTAIVTFADGGQVLGEAMCSSKDNYCKRIGRDIALGRALASLEATADAQSPERRTA
jgi:hypothetical protein